LRVGHCRQSDEHGRRDCNRAEMFTHVPSRALAEYLDRAGAPKV
jgi:hypothetical protein